MRLVAWLRRLFADPDSPESDDEGYAELTERQWELARRIEERRRRMERLERQARVMRRDDD